MASLYRLKMQLDEKDIYNGLKGKDNLAQPNGLGVR